ncbi:MAG: hypothetical protein H7296_10675 [Bacteroidia bacterium]|nr:hypothetical protein [Bacteroidia bacterium]
MNPNLKNAELIRQKVNKLLELYRLAENVAIQLREENFKLKQKLLDQTKRIEIVEERNKISKLADGILLNKQDVNQVKVEINRYIREVDECLKLLNHLPDNN